MLYTLALRCQDTAVYDKHTGFEYVTLGLCGEVGEVANKVKKFLRGDYPWNEAKEKIGDEMGDVFWYWCMTCLEAGLNPDEVIEKLFAKLAARKAAHTLKGSGDDR